jgi:hypothetical protein
LFCCSLCIASRYPLLVPTLLKAIHASGQQIFHQGLYINTHRGRIPYTGDIKMVTDAGGYIVVKDGGFLELDYAQVGVFFMTWIFHRCEHAAFAAGPLSCAATAATWRTRMWHLICSCCSDAGRCACGSCLQMRGQTGSTVLLPARPLASQEMGVFKTSAGHARAAKQFSPHRHSATPSV